MKIIYKAFDGTEFETKEECEEYEKLYDYDSLEMFDENYSPIKLLDDAWFIVVRNDLDKQKVEKRLDDNGYEYDDIRTIPTIIAWNVDSEQWEDLTVEAECLKGKLELVNKILNIMLGGIRDEKSINNLH